MLLYIHFWELMRWWNSWHSNSWAVWPRSQALFGSYADGNWFVNTLLRYQERWQRIREPSRHGYLVFWHWRWGRCFSFLCFGLVVGITKGQPMYKYRFGSVSPKSPQHLAVGVRCKIDVSGVVSVGLSLHLSPSIGVSWLWPVSFVSLCMPLSPTFTLGVFPRVSCFSLPLGGVELGPSSIYFPKYLSLWSSPFLTCLLIVACFLVSLLHITIQCFIIISSSILVYIILRDLGSLAVLAHLPKHVHACNSR